MTLRFSFELDPDLCPPGTAAGGSDGGRLSAIPFFRQGDKLTVKPGEKDKRYKMINDRGVKRALDRFWDTFKYKDVQYGVNREQVGGTRRAVIGMQACSNVVVPAVCRFPSPRQQDAPDGRLGGGGPVGDDPHAPSCA